MYRHVLLHGALILAACVCAQAADNAAANANEGILQVSGGTSKQSKQQSRQTQLPYPSQPREAAVVYVSYGDAAQVREVCSSISSLQYKDNDPSSYTIMVFYPDVSKVNGDSFINAANGVPSLGELRPLSAAQQAELQQCVKTPNAKLQFASFDIPHTLLNSILANKHKYATVDAVWVPIRAHFLAIGILSSPALPSPLRYCLLLSSPPLSFAALPSPLLPSPLLSSLALSSQRLGAVGEDCGGGERTGEDLQRLHQLAASLLGDAAAVRLSVAARTSVCRRPVLLAHNIPVFAQDVLLLDMKFMRAEAYTAFAAAVEASNGIVEHSWSHAMILSMAAHALLPAAAIAKLHVNYVARGSVVFDSTVYWALGTATLLLLTAAFLVCVCFFDKRALPFLEDKLLNTHNTIGHCIAFSRPCVNIVCCGALTVPAFPEYVLCGWSPARVAQRLRLYSVWDWCCGRDSARVHDAPLRKQPGLARPTSQSQEHIEVIADRDRDDHARFGGRPDVHLRIHPTGHHDVDAQGDFLSPSRHTVTAMDDESAATPSKPVHPQLRPLRQASILQWRRWVGITSILGLLGLLSSRSRLDRTIYPATSVLSTGTCYTDDLPCLLAAQADGSKRIIVTGATSGMLDFIENLLYSLHRLNVNNYLIFALDQEVAEHLARHNVPVYWDPAPLASLRLPDKAAGQTNSGLASGLFVVGEKTDATSSTFTFGSSEYQAVTMRKNEIIYEILHLGYNAFFTDADTVWLRNPLLDGATDLQHKCSALRLGDTVSAYGEATPQMLQRSDCAGGQDGLYNYDVIGMYGDVGGMDTGYWFIKSNTRSIQHMRNVMAFQKTPAGLQLPSDQETFNEMLKPWLPQHLAEPAHRGKIIDSASGFGDAKMRVAMFPAFDAPNGCRFSEAVASGADLLLVHANCMTGWWQKVPWMIRKGVWYIRLWRDSVVWSLWACIVILISARTCIQLLYSRQSRRHPPLRGHILHKM